MKIAIIAGEASGDLHGSNLMKSLHTLQPNLSFVGIGGDLMLAQGLKAIRHIRQTNFMGFWEVIKNLRTIKKIMKETEQMLVSEKPDVLILIDYPGFNLRMAKFAATQGIKVLYYISPQLWAWKKGRIRTIKKYVDKMYVILPFEQDFYQQEGNIFVDFVGHPLLDALAQKEEDITFRQRHSLDDRPIVALLPGSRKQEIKKILPIMAGVVSHFPQYQFVLGAAATARSEWFTPYLSDNTIKIVKGETYSLLENAYIGLVKSGTSTLETALFEVPEVVCYKGSWLSFQIGKRLVDKKMIKFISLVNLIMDREVVKELLQDQLTVEHLAAELNKLSEPEYRDRIKADYKVLRKKLGEIGASMRCARYILQEIEAH